MYYGEENNVGHYPGLLEPKFTGKPHTYFLTKDQWKKKKQTKAEAAAARRGKLDPDSELNRNAKQVMDERAQSKRKLRELQEEEEDDDDSDMAEEQVDDEDSFEIEGLETEQPGQGLKRHREDAHKKQKVQEESAEAEDEEDEEEAGESVKLTKKEEKLLAKKEKKKAKKLQMASGNEEPSKTDITPNPGKREHKEKADVRKKPEPEDVEKVETQVSTESRKAIEKKKSKQDTLKSAPEHLTTPDDSKDVEMDDVVPSGADSEPQSPIFDSNDPSTNPAEPASTTTSVSSTIPPSEKPKHIKLPADTSLLKERLAARIEALRAARKADGTNGKPIRTRHELIESRREKEAERKARKKEQRTQLKLEELKKREEALALNSPGMMSPAVEMDEATAGSFSFGRVAFGDGTQLSHDLNYVLNKKKKGPSDPKTALLKVQNQKKRLEDMDEDTRNDINEKEAWLSARRRVEGEKIRNDETLLKKAIKRKDVTKKKTEKAWKTRVQGVEQAQRDRQKKREDNLQQRRDEKALGKAGRKKKKKSKTGGAKKKARPGFEGSLGVSRRK